jgi:hypothetical protein
MKLSIRIQHVKKRERWAKTLKYLLGDKRTKIITDQKNILWEGAKKTLQSYDHKATHLLVLQDDVLPCQDFVATVERILELLPNEPITFYSPNESILAAQNLKSNWVTLLTWRNAQAYVLPVPIIDDFLVWAERHIKPEIYFDDDRFAMYFYFHKQLVYCTAPSLVEHMGWNSTTLTGYKSGHVFESRLRMAKWYIGFENSGLNIDWAATVKKPVFENDGDWGEWSHLYIP